MLNHLCVGSVNKEVLLVAGVREELRFTVFCFVVVIVVVCLFSFSFSTRFSFA